MGKLINENCIVFDIQGEKKDVIHTLAAELGKAGKITDTEEFYNDVLAREAISPTFVGVHKMCIRDRVHVVANAPLRHVQILRHLLVGGLPVCLQIPDDVEHPPIKHIRPLPTQTGQEENAPPLPVSYTHLDVYKRQSLSRASLSMVVVP